MDEHYQETLMVNERKLGGTKGQDEGNRTRGTFRINLHLTTMLTKERTQIFFLVPLVYKGHV